MAPIISRAAQLALLLIPMAVALTPSAMAPHRPAVTAASAPSSRLSMSVARDRWTMMPVPSKNSPGRSGRSSPKPKIGNPGGGGVGNPGTGPGGGGGEEGMQQDGGKGAGVAVITKERIDVDVDTDTEVKEDLDQEGWWRVLLHNDEIHTFEYVTESIVKVCPQLTKKKAFQITRTTHTAGVATVTTVWKQLAEQMCLGLQTYGLTVSIAPDANFNDNNEQAPEA